MITRTDYYYRLTAPTEVRITIDGTPLPFSQLLMVLAGTVEGIGVGFKVLNRAMEEPGKFHLFATGISAMSILRQLHRFYRGTRLQGKNHFDDVISAMTLEPTDGKNISYMLDGELFRADRVAVGMGPMLSIIKA